MSTDRHIGSPGSYWDDATRPHRSATDRAWRTHCDTVHRDLLDRWLSASPAARALKTDLFDETTNEGLAPWLAASTGAVHGIDVAADIVAEAARRLPDLRCSLADVRSLPYTDGAFDRIVSNSTLDHFARRDDIRSAIRELCRVLAPTGTLLVTLDNLDNPVVWLRSVLPLPLLRRLHLVPYFVGVTLGERQFVAELEAAGLVVAHTERILHAPRIPAMVACRLVDALGRPSLRRALLRLLHSAEALERLPTRHRTGYYVAALAQRADGTGT